MSRPNNAGIPEIGPALSASDLADIYRFKYEIYVDEMGRYQSIADHLNRSLKEADDDRSHIYQARIDGELVGTMRFTWGGDGEFSERHIGQYDLEPFLDRVPRDQIVIGERFMIDPTYRGTDLLFRMFCAYMAFVNERRIQFVFGDCEAHLLNTYQSLGFRTYTRRNVNSPDTGYLIPLVIVSEDLGYMRKIGSPLADVLTDFGAESRIPSDLDPLLKDGEAVVSQKFVEKDEYWARIKQAMSDADLQVTWLFEGMTDDEVLICLEKSNTIDCQSGDRVIKKGNPAKNIYLALSGKLEVREESAVVATISAGEIFGEIAFFLKLPRTMDVYAVGDNVRVVSFSETAIRKLIESHSETAAKLLLNISKILCTRMIRGV